MLGVPAADVDELPPAVAVAVAVDDALSFCSCSAFSSSRSLKVYLGT